MHLLLWHAVLILRFLIIGGRIPSCVSLTGEHWRSTGRLVVCGLGRVRHIVSWGSIVIEHGFHGVPTTNPRFGACSWFPCLHRRRRYWCRCRRWGSIDGVAPISCNRWSGSIDLWWSCYSSRSRDSRLSSSHTLFHRRLISVFKHLIGVHPLWREEVVDNREDGTLTGRIGRTRTTPGELASPKIWAAGSRPRTSCGRGGCGVLIGLRNRLRSGTHRWRRR